MNAVLDPPTAPPAIDAERGGGGSDWVQLIRAANDIDAHLLAGRLLESGIESRAIKDNTVPAWLIGGSDPWTPVAVLVRRFQLDESRIVLAELSFAGPDAPPLPVSREPRWRAAVVWWVAAIVLGVLFTGIGLLKTADYLTGCRAPAQCAAP
ncbi:MAG: DUF2007 domain-containing protein [Gaiellales bacterium]